MKLNHLKCPQCGHDWYEDTSTGGVCDICHTSFFIDQSRTTDEAKSRYAAETKRAEEGFL